MRWPTPLTPIIIAKLLGGSGGSVTPASIVTATGQMDLQQAADTLDNIGGEPKKLTVTVTQSGGVFSADKTFADIEAAIAGGKTIEATYLEDVFHLQYYEAEESVAFTNVADWTNSTVYGLEIRRLSIANDDTISYLTDDYEQRPRKVTDLASTSITLASAAANIIYEYGELSALTVTAATATGDFIIRFTSGSTATTTNFPASMVFPEAFAAEASTRYEISVSNGYAVVQGWPVS